MDRFDALLATVASESRAYRIERLRSLVEQKFSVERVVDEILSSRARK